MDGFIGTFWIQYHWHILWSIFYRTWDYTCELNREYYNKHDKNENPYRIYEDERAKWIEPWEEETKK